MLKLWLCAPWHLQTRLWNRLCSSPVPNYLLNIISEVWNFITRSEGVINIYPPMGLCQVLRSILSRDSPLGSAATYRQVKLKCSSRNLSIVVPRQYLTNFSDGSVVAARFVPFFLPSVTKKRVTHFSCSGFVFWTMTTLSHAKVAEYMHNDFSSGVPSQARNDLERRLLRKLDLRMSLIIVLYALNFVSLSYRRILLACHLVLTAYHG